MSLDITEKRLSVVASLIAIIGAVVGLVLWITQASAPAPSSVPAEKTQSAQEKAGDQSTAQLDNPPSESTVPPSFWTRVMSTIRLINFTILGLVVLFFVALAITVIKSPPPKTEWVNSVVIPTGILSFLFVIYQVVMLTVGNCCGALDWPATITLLIAAPVTVTDILLCNVADHRNEDPDKVVLVNQVPHRPKPTR